jgi:uncharacterized protein
MNDVHTAVVARKIKRGREQEYEKWLGRLASALHGAPGYDGMTAISSPDPQGSVKTLLVRFVSAKTLSDWEQSSIRHMLVDEGNQFSTAYYQTAPGVETFFSVPGSLPAPPRWKMCILTIPAVYLLLNLVLALLVRLIPGLAEWPAQIRMVPVVCIMTVLLTYAGLPALSKLFAPWLFSRAAAPATKTFAPLKSEGRTL